ncbi:MAG: hypothetical protein QOI83_486, partial [Streptomycetaceae bacterium]|nr:hypothetical protein [Streptomycetaceae bacterium]
MIHMRKVLTAAALAATAIIA